MNCCTRILLVLVLLLGSWAFDVLAERVRPLLMEGKKTLYQKVLAKPDSQLYVAPGREDDRKDVVPFSVFYVYAIKTMGKIKWMQLGSDSHGTLSGWMPESSLVKWTQGLTVAFRNPEGHDRVLLFKSKDKLAELINQHDVSKYEKYYKAATNGSVSENSPIIAVQPATHVDIMKDFYLMPILQHEDIFLENEQATMLQVTTVPLKPRKEAIVNPSAESPATATKTDGFKAGVVFVIDSTLSMGPYIDRTRQAVRDIYQGLAAEQAGGHLSFGLIAYRDNTRVKPGLGYLARTFATLEQGQNADTFFAQVNAVKAARVSSKDFSEDAYAGVKQALDTVDWQNLDARYIVLITDAGARKSDDPLSSTKLSAEMLNKLTRDQGVALTVLHLLTPQGKKNHASAAKQYRTLSDFPGIGDLYFGVPTGDVKGFGQVIDALTQQISKQVKIAAFSYKISVAGAQPLVAQKAKAAPEKSSELDELQSKISKLGYALQMQYLQKQDGNKVPDVFNAWLLDHDFRNPERSTLEIRVLLTRDQLSDLYSVLKELLGAFEKGLISPRNFIEDVKTLAAKISRDPEQLKASAEDGNLVSMGLMQEYIEDLPYQSDVMKLSLDDWESWPVKRQVMFVHKLEEKMAYYRALHDHTDLWISPGGGAVTGSSVFALALEMLP